MANYGTSPLSDALHVLISVALVGTVYFCMMACCCRGGGPQQQPVSEQGETRITVENPVVEPIPAHKHQKRKGLVGEDGRCAICLCEFEEGEELRTLPECLHSYHMPCIDMWLYSHSSCPMCRSRVMPSSFILGRESKSGIASTR